MFRYKILIFLFFFISCSKDSTLFKVEIKSEPELGGTINFPTDLYAEGEILELKATPSKNFKFLSWSGDASGSDSIVQISVTNDKKIIANFEKKKHEINFRVNGQGRIINRLIKTGSQKEYTHGSIIEILAIPSNGWSFVGWTGDIDNDTSNPVNVTINKTKNITANFKKDFVGINTSKFLALGDSYTIGQSVEVSERWPVQFLEKLKNYTNVIDTLQIIAQTGWRVDELIDEMNKSNLSAPYGLVSLLIGVNNQFQGQDANGFRPEFIGILEKSIALVDNRKERLFIVSIPDWGSSPYGAPYDRGKISKEIDDFNSVIKEESEKRGVRFFDVTTISRRALTNTDLIADDGLHPSGEMYRLWVDKIIEVISQIDFD